MDWKKEVDDRIRFLQSMLLGIPALGIWAALLFFPELNWVNLIGLVGALFFAFTAYMCISYVIIGTYYYFFFDKDDECHCHKEAPLIRFGCTGHFWENSQYEPAEGSPMPEQDAFLITGMILRLKLGGWFKKNLVIRQSSGSMQRDLRKSGWHILKRTREQVTFKSACSLDSITTFPETALRLMECLHGGSLILGSSVADDQKRLSELRKELTQTTGLLDWLGIRVASFLRELDETPAWSRSKVRGIAKDRIREILGACPMKRCGNWMRGKPTPEGEAAYAAIVAEHERILTAQARVPLAEPPPRPAIPGEI